MATFPSSSLHIGDLVLVECNINRYFKDPQPPQPLKSGSSRFGGNSTPPSPQKKVMRLEDSYIPALKMITISLLADGPDDEDNKPRDAGVSFV